MTSNINRMIEQFEEDYNYYCKRLKRTIDKYVLWEQGSTKKLSELLYIVKMLSELTSTVTGELMDSAYEVEDELGWWEKGHHGAPAVAKDQEPIYSNRVTDLAIFVEGCIDFIRLKAEQERVDEVVTDR